MILRSAFTSLIMIYVLLSPNYSWSQIRGNPVEWVKIQSEDTLRKNSLKVNIKSLGKKQILAAGSGQFATLWTRDFAIASLGALAFNHSEPVRGGLEALFKYQRKDGLIPRRLDGVSNVLRGALGKVGIHLPPPKVLKKPEYKSGLGGTPIDSNALIAWVTEEYVKVTNDLSFANNVYANLQLAFDWLQNQEHNGLLNQEPFADWKDVTRRKGKVMYTNALYYRGLQAMINLSLLLDKHDLAASYLTKSELIKKKINEEFWQNDLGYFKDRAQDNDTLFSADGNFFAIIFGIANEEQAESILIKSDELLLDDKLGLYANVDRAYPKSFVPASVRIMGIRGYSDNTFVYPWNTALYILAALTHNNETNRTRANIAVNSLVKIIEKDGFQEAYEPGGKPVHRWAHKSEPDFSWFAGLMSLATHQLLLSN